MVSLIAGLSDCLTNQEQCFNVDLSEAGQGRMSIFMDGPVNTDMKITDSTNSYCTATYVPTVKGSYNVNVLVDNEHVTGEYCYEPVNSSGNRSYSSSRMDHGFTSPYFTVQLFLA